jgi:hypothetical protein
VATGKRKTPLNDAAKSLRETERRIRAIEKQVKKTGRLRDPKTGSFSKVNARNIKKVQKEIVRDVKQTSKTLKAAQRFASSIADLFKSKKGAKPSKTKSPSTKKTSSKSSAKATPLPVSQSSTKLKQPQPLPSKSGKQLRVAQLPEELRRNRAYQAIELPQSFHTHVFEQTLENLERDGTAYDKQFLQLGDVWGYKIGYRNQRGQWVGGYGTSTFSSFDRMIKHIHGYGSGGGVAKGSAFDPRLYDSPNMKETQETLFHVIRFNRAGPLEPRATKGDSWSQQRKEINMKKAESKLEYGRKMKAKETAKIERAVKRADERAERRAEKKYEEQYQKKLAEKDKEIERLTKQLQSKTKKRRTK